MCSCLECQVVQATFVFLHFEMCHNCVNNYFLALHLPMYTINDEISNPYFYLTNKANVHHVLYVPLFGMIICKAFITLVLLGLEFF